jgi:putative transposase
MGDHHLKVSRQRKDKAIKDALALLKSKDLIVYEDLNIQNMVKNHQLAKSISDASWYQFTQWLQYFAKIYGTIVVAVPPHNTTVDCSSCGAKVHKTTGGEVGVVVNNRAPNKGTGNPGGKTL